MIEAAALAFEIAGAVAAGGWWIVRSLWKIDVRLTRIEDHMGIEEKGRARNRVQRKSSTARVVKFGDAVGRDYGEL
ncbi:MAG TPA: hypothetical protein VHU87_14555 [Rhizomicrobium sp.]|jgi:hypothetical protein|nr:hypothetical protein [Rhizomicrobium sp.]